jgi:TatA/E family protein of Tat protein translocase
MPFNIGPLELVIILVIALLILGPGRLPEVGSALGKSIREFRKAATEVQDATKIDVTTSAKAPTTTAPASEPTAPAAPQVANVSSAEPVPNVLSETVAPNEISVEPKA